ncbi:Cleavage and polyadenylation specificity factor subunit 1, partial [Bonamia ostreae]
RHAVSEFACEVVDISFNLKQKSYSVFKRINHLPLDCQSVFTSKSFIDGALIFSPSLVLRITKEVDFAISLNDFAKLYKNHDAPIENFGEVQNFDNCKFAQISENVVLISKVDGKCFLLRFFDKKMILEKCSFELGTLPSQITLLNNSKLIFVASYNGDSLLIQIDKTETIENGKKLCVENGNNE